MTVPARVLCLALLACLPSSALAQEADVEDAAVDGPTTDAPEPGEEPPPTEAPEVPRPVDLVPPLERPLEAESAAEELDAPAAVDAAVVVEATETWALFDGSGDEVPWQYVSPPRLPTGPAILGVQLRLGGVLGTSPAVTNGPAAEVALVFDVRYARGPFHLRLALGVDLEYAEVGVDRFGGSLRQPSPFAVRGRILPLAFDVGPAFAQRFGADVGFWLIDGDGHVSTELLAGAISESALRFRQLDGLLEIALYVGFQLRASRRLGSFPTTSLEPQAVFGLQAMWVFL